jgi:hypothetical protein
VACGRTLSSRRGALRIYGDWWLRRPPYTAHGLDYRLAADPARSMCVACGRAVRTVVLLCWLLPHGMAQPQASTRREALSERGTDGELFGGQERYSAEALHRLDETETAVDEQLQQALDRADKAGLLAPYYEDGTTAASRSLAAWQRSEMGALDSDFCCLHGWGCTRAAAVEAGRPRVSWRSQGLRGELWLESSEGCGEAPGQPSIAFTSSASRNSAFMTGTATGTPRRADSCA